MALCLPEAVPQLIGHRRNLTASAPFCRRALRVYETERVNPHSDRMGAIARRLSNCASSDFAAAKSEAPPSRRTEFAGRRNAHPSFPDGFFRWPCRRTFASSPPRRLFLFFYFALPGQMLLFCLCGVSSLAIVRSAPTHSRARRRISLCTKKRNILNPYALRRRSVRFFHSRQNSYRWSVRFFCWRRSGSLPPVCAPLRAVIFMN